MSIWAGIKHALNSTVGTSKFMPLDKLLEKRTVLASTDALWVTKMGSKRVEISTGTPGGEVVYGEILSLQNSNLVGTINLGTSVEIGVGQHTGQIGEGVSGRVHLYKNDTLIASTEQRSTFNNESRLAKSYTFDVSFMNVAVDAGDELKFVFEVQRYTTYSDTTTSVCYITGNNNVLTISGTLGDYVNITGTYL